MTSRSPCLQAERFRERTAKRLLIIPPIAVTLIPIARLGTFPPRCSAARAVSEATETPRESAP
ncbi:unnamed protein product [Ectocarpus sp. 6 AP-2014]